MEPTNVARQSLSGSAPPASPDEVRETPVTARGDDVSVKLVIDQSFPVNREIQVASPPNADVNPSTPTTEAASPTPVCVLPPQQQEAPSPFVGVSPLAYIVPAPQPTATPVVISVPISSSPLGTADFVGTAGHGSRQSPCFDHAGCIVFVPAGAAVHVCEASAIPRPIPSALLGLSDVIQAAAYDPAQRLVFLGDQNGYASRLVAADPVTHVVRWTTPDGSLNSCCGICVLPQQSVVVASSLSELHVRQCGTGESIFTLGGLRGPTFLAADPATSTIFASTVRVPPRGSRRTLSMASSGGPRGAEAEHVVSVYRWDATRRILIALGELVEAGAAVSPRPLTVVPGSDHHHAHAHLVVGTCGTADLCVLELPSCRAIHTCTLMGSPPPAITGCCANPSGTLLAVVDAAAGSTRLLPWPLPGFPAPAQRVHGAPDASGDPTSASGPAFVCVACRLRMQGTPVGCCRDCLPPQQSLHLMGWLCHRCLAEHRRQGAPESWKQSSRRYAMHGSAVAVTPGLQTPISIPDLAVPAEATGIGAQVVDLDTPQQQQQQDRQPEVPRGPQACSTTGPRPITCVPCGNRVEFFDSSGGTLPGLDASALALSTGSVRYCAFDGASGSLVVSDGNRVVAVDLDTRAVRWSAAVPDCVGLCILSQGE